MAIRIRQATADGYITMPYGAVCDLSYPTSKFRRARVQDGGLVVPAICAGSDLLVVITIYETKL